MPTIPHVSAPRQEVIDAVEAALDGNDVLSRCVAVHVLARIEPDSDRAGSRLIAVLDDLDPDVRAEAAAALGHLRAATAVAPLVRLLRSDREPVVRIQVVAALAQIARTAKEATEPLIDCVQNDGYPALDDLARDFDFRISCEVQARAIKALGAAGDPRAVAPLVRLIEGGCHEDLEETALRALAQLDTGAAREFILRQLQHGTRTARRRAASALAAVLPGQGCHRYDAPGVRDGLIKALTDVDPTVRAAAACSLGTSTDPVVTTALAALLADPDLAVRQCAVQALAKVGGEAALRHLQRVVGGRDEKLKPTAISALAEVGDASSAATLVSVLDSADPDLLAEAVHAIGRIGVAEAQDKLAAILARHETDARVRIRAAEALASLLARTKADPERAGTTASTRDAVVLATADQDIRIAQAAFAALLKIDRDDAVARLVALLGKSCARSSAHEVTDERPVGAVSANAPLANQHAGAIDEPASSTLASILAGAAIRVRSRMEECPRETSGERRSRLDESAVIAARLLGAVDRPGAAAVLALTTAASSAAADLRREALISLGRVGGAQALPAVAAAMRADELEVRLAACDAYARLAPAEEAGIRIAELLADPEAVVRQRAARTLASLGVSTAARFLPEALYDDDCEVVRIALWLLAASGQGRASAGRLVDLMFLFSGELRREAAVALRACRDDTAVGRLLSILADPEQDEVHWICIDALGELVSSPRLYPSAEAA